MKRRTILSFAAIAVLLVGAFLVPRFVRAHVDGLIQASVGKALPQFTLRDRDGREWNTAALQGRRAVLHFFRSRCHSCDVEAPEIRDLERRLPDDVVLLHVMTDAVLEFAPELAVETLAKKSFTRPVLMADAAFVDAFHHVDWSNVTPITYVVDARSIVRFGLRGAQTAASIEEALAAAR